MGSDVENKIVRILTGLAILTLIASLLLPVWSMETSVTIGDAYDDSIHFYPYQMKEESTTFGNTDDSTAMLTELSSDLQGPLALLIVTTVIAIFLSLVAFFNDHRWRSSKGGKIALALSALTALASPLLFMTLWTDAINSDSNGYEYAFSGKESSYGFDVNYGPEFGWYLQFVAFGLLVFALFLSLRMNKKSTV